MKIICILTSLMPFVGACSKKVGTERKKKEEAKIGSSFDHIPRVEIVKKIEPFLQKAISEKWNKQAWIDKFGNPWRNEIRLFSRICG